jgi:signal peptidase I
MRKFPRLPSLVINFIMVAGLAAIWFAFAPLNIGGQTSYVVVNGISMEPGFHRGDVVIMREASTYQIGDVVTYHNAEMGGAFVIHRIIGMEQDRYVLKGDNNSWLDAYHPAQDEIIGKLWIHSPQLGIAMQWLRLPVNMALTTALLGGILMTSMLIQPKKHGKGKNKPSGNSAGGIEMALYTLGFIALVFLGLSIFAFSRPATRTVDKIKYQQTGVFFYSASVIPGIYDTEMVRSGEPVFPKLTCSINVGFVYNLVGDQLQEISGSQQLNAYVSDAQSGWQRTIPLQAETTFSGNSYSTTAALDLCQVQTLVDSVGQETGFRPSTYILTIIPHVAINAKAAGQNLSDTFEPKLVFNFDKVHFYLAGGSKPETDPLRTSKDGLMNTTATQANTVSALGFEFNVIDLRILGLVGLGFALFGLLILGWYIFNTAQSSQEALIRIKYGALIMEVYDRGFESVSPVIDVATIDDLAKLAERQNTMILHMMRDYLQFYLVQSEGTTYRYVVSEGRHSPPKSEAPRPTNSG